MIAPFFLLWGFLIWLIVTVALRLTAQYYLNPEHPYFTALTFLRTIPLTGALTYPVYDWRGVYPLDRPLAAIFLVLPGMLLDGIVLLLFEHVLPNLDGNAWLFAAWLFWAYALALMTGFVSISRLRRL